MDITFPFRTNETWADKQAQVIGKEELKTTHTQGLYKKQDYVQLLWSLSTSTFWTLGIAI